MMAPVMITVGNLQRAASNRESDEHNARFIPNKIKNSSAPCSLQAGVIGGGECIEHCQEIIMEYYKNSLTFMMCHLLCPIPKIKSFWTVDGRPHLSASVQKLGISHITPPTSAFLASTRGPYSTKSARTQNNNTHGIFRIIRNQKKEPHYFQDAATNSS